MPRTDRSVTILTGMIIAALYVILLVGFSPGILHAARRREPRRRGRSLAGRAARRIGCRTAELLPRRAAGVQASEPVVPLTLDGCGARCARP